MKNVTKVRIKKLVTGLTITTAIDMGVADYLGEFVTEDNLIPMAIIAGITGGLVGWSVNTVVDHAFAQDLEEAYLADGLKTLNDIENN